MAEKANPIDVELVLKNTSFPASKNQLLQFVRDLHAAPEIVSAVEQIPNRNYINAADAARETFYPEQGMQQLGQDSCDD